MKHYKQKRKSSKRNTDKVAAFVCLAALLIILLVAKASGTTYFTFTYPSGDGTGGRFIVRAEISGDSIAGGTLVETDRGTLTYWAGSTSVDIGSYIVEGIVAEGSDTTTGSYRVDVSAKAAYDSLLIILDSVESQDGWVAHQTTADSLYDSLLIILDSLEALETWIAHQTTIDTLVDSINGYDGWLAHQTTVDSLWDSLLALQDTTEAALSDAAIGDKIWIDASSRTLSAYRWTIAERDSVLAALTDAAIGDKVWIDGTPTNRDSIIAALSDASISDKAWQDGTPANRDSILNAIEDANKGNFKATGYATHNAADIWTSATRTLSAFGFSVALSSGQPTNIAESTWAKFIEGSNEDQFKATGFAIHNATDIWNIDFGTGFDAGSMGDSINNSSYVQGSASGLTAAEVSDSVWNKGFGTGFTGGSMGDSLNNASYVQGSASGLTAGQVADAVWDEDTTGHRQDGTFGKDARAWDGGSSLTLEDISERVCDSINARDSALYAEGYWHKIANRSDSGIAGGGSDTGAIKSMMLNNLFSRVATDTPIVLWNDGKVKLSDTDHAAIEDTIHANVADYKATGYSSHNAADIWTAVGGDSVLNAIDDANKTNFKADISALSTHSVLDVYNQFIAGTNEEVFWTPKANIADTTWAKFNDGSNEDNFKADVSLLALQSEVANLDGWNPLTDNDSLIIDMSSLSARPLIGDTIQKNASIFIPASDSVIVDVLSAITAGGLVSNIEDSVHANAADYKATGYSTHGAADVWIATGGDSVLNALEDANKDNFKADTNRIIAIVDSILDSLKSQDDWIAHQSTIDSTVDTSAATYAKAKNCLDSLQAQDDWIAHQSTVDTLVDSANSYDGWIAHQTTSDSLYDSLLIILDSLEQLESWVAHQTTSDSLYDSLLIILDSLEALEAWVAEQTEVANLDGWNPITINESLVVAMAPLGNRPTIGDTIQRNASTLTASDNIGVNLDDVAGTLDSNELGITTVAKIWEHDTSSISAGIGQMLKDTGAYQGSASGLTVNQIVDGIWNEDTAGHNTSQSFGLMLKDTLVYQGGATSAWNSTQRDSVLAALSDNAMDDKVWTDPSTRTITDKSGFSLTAEERGHIEDSIHAQTADYKADVAALIDTCNAVIDSLQNWYDEIATINSMADSLYAVLDSIQNQDNWIGTVTNQELLLDSLYAALDSLQSQYGWVASHSAADIWTSATRTLSVTGIDAFWDEDTTGHGTASSFAVMLKDTGVYQGAAAGITATEISDSVWNKAQSAYTTVGTFGYNLDTTISSVDASGSGAYAFNVVVVDSGAATDSVIPDARVYVNNQSQSATPYQAITNNNGIAAFQINAGTWVRFTTEPGFATNLDTFTNSGSATETLYVYRDAGSRTTVAFELNKPNGDPYGSAKININLVSVNDSILRIGDTIVVSDANYEIFATANSEGLASINLDPNSDYTNDSTYYRCVIRDRHNRLIVDRFKCRVPDTSIVMRYQNLTRWE